MDVQPMGRVLKVLGIGILWLSPTALAQDGGYTWSNDFGHVLDVRFDRFECRDCSIEDFVDTLSAETGVAANAIRWNGWQDDPAQDRPRISVVLDDATPREILDYVITPHPEYTWLRAEGNAVNIVPTSHIADRTSKANTKISYVSDGPVPLGEAIVKIMRLATEAGATLTGTISPNSHDSVDPYVDVSLTDVSVLEALNAVFLAAGPGYHYRISDKFMTWGYEPPENIVMPIHVAARETSGFAEANERYREAIREAPYRTLKMRIASEYARRLIRYGGEERREGFKILYALLDEIPNSLLYPKTCQAVVEGILDGLRKNGKREKGTAFVVDLLENNTMEGRLSDLILYRALIGTQIYRQNSAMTLESLRALRNVLPDDPEFHAKLDKKIRFVEEHVAHESGTQPNAGDEHIDLLNFP